MCKNSEPVFLVRDTALQSERDGSAAIYWAPSSTWAAFRGATAISLRFQVLSGSSTAIGRVFAETSVDGITWESWSGTGGLISSGMTIAEYNSGTGTPSGTTRFYATEYLSDAPFVRFGVQVEDESESQGQLRLTLAATPVQGGGDINLAYNDSANAFPADTLVGAVFQTANLDQLVISGLGASFAPSASALVLDLYTGPTYSPSTNLSTWTKVPNSTLTITEGVTVWATTNLDPSELALSNYAALRVTSVTGGSITGGTFSAHITARTRS